MNRHLKAAFFVAPFLLIGGYIIADYYQTEKVKDLRAAKYALHELKSNSECKLEREQCMLHSDKLLLDIFVAANRYRVVSNMPLDNVTMALAQSDRETRAVSLIPHEGQRQWSMAVRKLTNLDKDNDLLLRIVATDGNDQYYAEIPIDPSGPWN